ncbi:MAG: PadR family transcriptional regulator [Vulcanimicrobiaceae bacterium]
MPRPADEVLSGPIKSKTIFPVLILHLLEQSPDYGYGIMQRIEKLCADLLAVNTNTVYPLLRRLEERGFISGAWEHPTKRSRRIYRITPSGRERLAKIKNAISPYLNVLLTAVERLRDELYERDAEKASKAS